MATPTKKLTTRALEKLDKTSKVSTKASLETWANSATAKHDPDELHQDGDDDEEVGDDAFDSVKAREILLGGSVKGRRSYLEGTILKGVKRGLDQAQTSDLLKILISTLPRYFDSPSRHSVLLVLSSLLSSLESKKISTLLIKWLDSEIERREKSGTVASDTRYALLLWATTIFDGIMGKGGEGVEEIAGGEWDSIVRSLGGLLDGLLDEKASTRRSIKQAAVVLVRKTIRINYQSISRLITTLTTLSFSPSSKFAPFLGLVMDVSLRLKDPKGKKNVGKSYVEENKEKVNAYFSANVLNSKTTPPARAITAFTDFFASTLTSSVLLTTFLPSLISSLPKTPEPALLTLHLFLSSLPSPLVRSSEVRKALVTPLVGQTKSVNSLVRSSVVNVFRILFVGAGAAEGGDLKEAAKEISTPLKTAKTSSPDHRATLFNLLSVLPPSSFNSPEIVTLTLNLLPKESNELALNSMLLVLSIHLPSSLSSPTSANYTALLKGLSDPKPLVRRAFHKTIGSVLYALKGNEDGAKYFAEGVLAGLENALKNVSANPLTVNGGALEGFVAVALLRGNLGRFGSKKIDTAVTSNPVLNGIYTTGAKPSFVLWDKVYKKVKDDEEEEGWLLRALESVLQSGKEKFAKDAALRVAWATGVIHVAVESTSHESRKAAGGLLQKLNEEEPKLIQSIMRDGLRSWLVQAEKTKEPTAKALDDDSPIIDKFSRLRPLLIALSIFPESASYDLRESLLSEMIVIAHHPKLNTIGIWIEMLQYAKVEPEGLIHKSVEKLLESIWEDASLSPSSELFAQAAYRAATTLAFVAPSVIVPRIFAQFEDDLAIRHLVFMGSFEYGVWATPEGSTFVDVLAAQKPKAPVSHKNSKDREIEIWEAELRESLARKKPVAATLSKPERILFDKQLAKEAETRTYVSQALGRLRRGFALLLCLVSSRAENVRELLATMVKDVLAVIVLRPATLVAPEAFATYQTLGDICSDRLGQSKVALGVAVLRALEAKVVPEEYSTESLAALVTRVLYRLRFLAEQTPFDAGTFAYAAPLVSTIVRAGGIGLPKSDAEGSLEQLALALDVVAFHARECSDAAFPRLSMIGDLVATLISYPSLSRVATTALADLADAMKDSASLPEIEALLTGAMTEEAFVRFACLQALQPLDLTELEFPANLWISVHDVDERNRQLAVSVWEENGLDVPKAFLHQLLPSLSHASPSIRAATAEAVAEGLSLHPTEVAKAIQMLITEYREKSKEIVPVYDQFGMIIEESLTVEDPWRSRVALASTFKLISVYFSPADVEAFFDLLIEGGALGDRSQAVRSEMLEAAMAVIDSHGKENLQSLIAKFEAYLSKPASGDAVQDHITESLVILFGRLARHLDPKDARVKAVIGRLVDALRTPSEVVQLAVCECLPPLIRVIKDDVPALVDQLMNDLFQAPKYAERRGAAYGLAGVARGRGLSTLKEFGVLGQLHDNAEDKQSKEARQGAIFGYEILSTVLGRLFEPYIQETLPILLASFGDSSRDVREATQDAAKAIMGKLSGHAVKLILPTLLAGLDDKQWRAKKGAIELMGAMAFLAPKQLSLSLPTILPRLTEVLTDTHKQVREAANASLKRFGEVVTNPEIQVMTSVLLEALVDPSRKTPKALDALLATTFAHFIDASSLALVIPILDRGLRERSADVKRKASAIVGNMATLTEAKDLVPYLSQLVPLLRNVLIDPVPEARSTAAKSLGGLVERLGENNFPDLLDSLMEVLKSPASGVDQQGAAQGVSEILAGLGTDRLEGVLPTILSNTSSPRAYVREGHISLLIFLPSTFGDRFSPYLGRIIQPVLSGLADDSDYVREASMRAGRMIVANHSTKAIDLLLPELELGLFDGSWRIRQSSVQLVGDLLFRISGVSGKPDEDDDGEDDMEDVRGGVDNTKKALVDTLGKDRRDRVLSALYIVRQDPVGVVRQAALHVWKALVQNTPRTVREMLIILMQIIVRTLASPGIEQRETAARCLADTCRKLGETVLGEVISILQKAMNSPERRQREGVCLALTELMANSNSSSLEAHEEAVIACIRSALVDSDPQVRSAAAQTFDVAQQVIGPRSIDETIPTLLDALQQPGETADAALAALKEVMTVRSEKIFPVLIPRLIATPITAFNARALASLVRVAGAALGRRLTQIVDALQNALKSEKDEDTLNELDEALTAVLASVEDHESGLGSLQMHMLGLAKHEAPEKRVTGCNLFMRFCQATEADFSDYTVDWIRQLVSLFDDRSSDVVGSAWMALDALVKTIEKEDMEPLVVPLRRTIESTGTPGVPVDGFSRPNGLKPILPILLQGLLSGTGEQREQAAYGLGDLVERTSPEAFKAYCIQTVGPLIRVIGDRFPAPVKSAILSTLTVLLTRVPQFVKPFFPQLQRTFVKSLSDTTSLSVRNRGAAALAVLMVHQTRVDPLVTELTNLVSTEDGEIRDSVVEGLSNVVKSGGANLSDASKSAVMDVLSEAFAETNKESYNVAMSHLFSSLALHSATLVEPLLTSYIFTSHLPPTQLSSLSLLAVVENSPDALFELGLQVEAVQAVVRMTASGTSPAVARPSRETKELMKDNDRWNGVEGVDSL